MYTIDRFSPMEEDEELEEWEEIDEVSTTMCIPYIILYTMLKYVGIYIHIYIYIERERERERYCIYLYIDS